MTRLQRYRFRVTQQAEIWVAAASEGEAWRGVNNTSTEYFLELAHEDDSVVTTKELVATGEIPEAVQGNIQKLKERWADLIVMPGAEFTTQQGRDHMQENFEKARDLVSEMNGIDRRDDKRLNKFAERARALGLVIVYGCSDDLIEFEGAFRDEGGAPGITYLTPTGIWEKPDFCEQSEDSPLCPHLKAEMESCKKIESLWCGSPSDPAWTYKTDLPHFTFQMMDDGEVYCRGLVFHIDALKS